MIQQSGFFGITLFGEKQKEISDLFDGYNKAIQDHFDELKILTLTSGVPYIKGGLAYLDCKAYHRRDMPKSIVIVGEVLDGRLGEAALPLAYLNREYVRLISQE